MSVSTSAATIRTQEETTKMGRRRNNPELVQELIDRRWDSTMGEGEYNEKYSSLSSSDMSEVSGAIYGMEAEFLGDDDDDD